MKRIVCLLLAVCLLGVCLTACGQAQPQPQKEPQDAETVKENDLPKAPEAPETAEAAEAVKTPAEGEFPSNDISASQVVTGERVLENVSFVVAYDPFIYKEKDEECDLNYTVNEAANVPVEYAISTSLGFGGHNACIAFKRYEA